MIRDDAAIDRTWYAIFCCPWDAHTETVYEPEGDMNCPRCQTLMDVIEVGVVAVRGIDGIQRHQGEGRDA